MIPRHSLLALALTLATATPSLAQWTLRTPMTNPERIHGAIWDGTRFMVAGGFGYTATSSDGIHWDKRIVPGNPNLLGLATNGKGLIAALDDSGHTWATTDGLSWTRSDTSLGLRLGSLHWTGSRFAAGENSSVGSVYRQAESVDGLHWGPDSSKIDPGYEPTFAFDSTIEFRLYYSLNSRRPGHGWTPCSTGTTRSMYGIAKGQGKWVVVGDSGIILSSPDGTSWAKGSIGSANKLRQVAYLGGLWILVGDSCTVYTSPDAQSWTRRIKLPTLPGTNYAGFWRPRIVRDTTRWTIVENAGRGRVLTSLDGIQWSVETISGDAAFGTAAEEETSEMLLSSGTGTLLVRRNGILAWRQGAADWVVPDLTPRAILQSVVHQNGIWLAAGVQGDSTLVWRSTDGVAWSASRLIFNGSYQSYFRGLFAARGLFIASSYVGSSSGSTMVSEDGLSWTSSGDCMLSKIADNGRILVGIDPGNLKVYSSEDGRTWTLRKSTASFDGMVDVAWNGERFVAIGEAKTLWTSTNGIDWDVPDLGSSPVGDLRALGWNGSSWLVEAEFSSFASTDGKNWIRTGAGDWEATSGIAWRGALVVGTGSSTYDNFHISTTIDGLKWTSTKLQGPNAGVNGRFTGFHDLGDTLYALTNRAILYRTGDVKNWQPERFTGNAIEAMAHADGLLVAVGDNSNIWTRPTTAPDVGVALRSSAKSPSIVVSSGRMRIAGGAHLSADLLDMQGRILSHGSQEGSDLVLDLAGRSRGTLALRLREAGGVTTRLVAIP
jgi:hypothetical protein